MNTAVENDVAPIDMLANPWGMWALCAMAGAGLGIFATVVHGLVDLIASTW